MHQPKNKSTTIIKEIKLPKEGYTLKTGNKGMAIYASAPEGVFYALQTVMKLSPVDIYNKNVTHDFSFKIKGI